MPIDLIELISMFVTDLLYRSLQAYFIIQYYPSCWTVLLLYLMKNLLLNQLKEFIRSGHLSICRNRKPDCKKFHLLTK